MPTIRQRSMISPMLWPNKQCFSGSGYRNPIFRTLGHQATARLRELYHDEFQRRHNINDEDWILTHVRAIMPTAFGQNLPAYHSENSGSKFWPLVNFLGYFLATWWLHHRIRCNKAARGCNDRSLRWFDSRKHNSEGEKELSLTNAFKHFYLLLLHIRPSQTMRLILWSRITLLAKPQYDSDEEVK